MSNKFNEDASGIKSYKSTSNVKHKSKKIIFLPIAAIGVSAVFAFSFMKKDDADDFPEFTNTLPQVSTQKAENDSKTATSESSTQENETPLYLDQLALIETDRYTGNEGDSFVYPIGQHQYSHGVECTDGQNYDHGIEAWIARWNYSAESSWAYGVFQLDNKYTSLRGQCKLLQSYNTTDFNTSLEFWDGDTLLQSYVITPDAIPFDISVDVTGCKELKVYFYDNVETSGGTAFALVNMELSCDDVESSTESTEDNMLVHSDAVEYGSNYYMLYSDVTASWEEAKQYCEQLGGHLAVINNVDENAFLYSYMLNCGYESAYFGFIDENQDGNWKWVDGTTGNYTNWAGGEPSSLSEPYGMYYYKFTDGTWNDGRWGDDTAAFICEWESSASETSNTTASSTISDFSGSIKEVYATSQLATQIYSDKTYDYSPQKAVDNDMSTCWSEGVDDYGTGESITLSFDNIYEINEIHIWNGLCASEDLFYKNSRLREISIAFSDGQSIDFECNDGWNNRENVIVLPTAVETSSIVITIKSVYEGEKYKDTCVSEISVS